MKKPHAAIAALALAFSLPQQLKAADNLVPTACKFEHLPLILIISRGGMGAKDNTVQIGDNKPVPLNIGSSLMIAEFKGQEFVLSLRMPASVSVSSRGADTVTYHGECISSPPR
jgi:hypothetical protein